MLWTAHFLLETIVVELGGIQWYDDRMRLIYSHAGAQGALETTSSSISSNIEDNHMLGTPHKLDARLSTV